MTLRPPIHMFPNYLKDVISQACPGTDLAGGGVLPVGHAQNTTARRQPQSQMLNHITWLLLKDAFMLF